MSSVVGRQERRVRGVPPNAPPLAKLHRLGAPVTASSLIHRDLRNDIVSLRRLPGDAISEKVIAANYGVSRTPVREAILRLAEEKLVEVFPQSGTFVARIPVSGLTEAIVVRTSLEGTMARIAAERRDPAGLEALAAMIERQKAAAHANDRELFHDADEGFHSAIAEAAGYPGVWTLVQNVKTQVDRYRRLTLPVPGRMLAVVEEHMPILEAVRAGDADGAAQAMANHLQALMTFAEIRHINPDFFLDDSTKHDLQDA